MKKVLSILLVLVMSLSLCACGEKNDTSSTTEESITTQDINMEKETTTTPDTNTENETTTTPDYASELTDILCSGKWVREKNLDTEPNEELTFNANGTFSWISDEGIEEWNWGYHTYYEWNGGNPTYYESKADLPIPISAVIPDDSPVYWGEAYYGDEYNGTDYLGHSGFIVGYNEEGIPVMSFATGSWIREE